MLNTADTSVHGLNEACGAAQPRLACGSLPGALRLSTTLLSATLLSTTLLGAALTGVAGCKSQATYLRETDEAVYAIIEARRADLATDAHAFTIEPLEGSLRERMLAGEPGVAEALTLVDCLRIAGETNRSWQDRREALYLDALDLTLERWRFGWVSTAAITGSVDGSGKEASTAAAGGSYAFSQILGSGAKIVGDLGLSISRSLSSGDAWHASSNLGLSITQPLLRGFGSEVTYEPLTQAERNVVYAARNYERFRRTLAVQVAERYYRILQQADELGNERTNYENLILLRERNEALSLSGRLSEIQVNQAQQDELRAKSRVIEAEQRLESLLDDFKFFLGLPTAAPMSIDRTELDRLTQRGATAVDIDEAAAIRLALAERLDLANLRGEIEDAERRVRISADDLRMGLDVGFDVNAVSEAGKPFKYLGSGVDWTLDATLDLAIDRTPERNVWRASLIALRAARRARELLEDQLSADLRDELRSLVALRTELEIQINSVALADRRVESTRLNFDAGRAETRDLLEAQEALVTAKNAATRARIDYELARLALYRDLEALRVEGGSLDVDAELDAKLEQHASPAADGAAEPAAAPAQPADPAAIPAPDAPDANANTIQSSGQAVPPPAAPPATPPVEPPPS